MFYLKISTVNKYICLILFFFKLKIVICENDLSDSFNESNDTLIENQSSRIRDVQIAENDTCLTINFVNSNDQQMPFYLHCVDNYKFNMELFTEDRVQVNFVNTYNNSYYTDAALNLNKLYSYKNIDLVNYELTLNLSKTLTNFCWNLTYEKNHYWYGAPSILKQHWPIDSNTAIEGQPYITSNNNLNATGSLTEYLWLSSSGYLIFVDHDVPLFIQMENNVICLSARYDADPYYSKKIRKKVEYKPFKVQIVVSKNIKEAYFYYLKNFVNKPQQLPNLKFFSYNIWSTWNKFKNDINEISLIEFAKNISKNGFTKYGSILEIDDKWEKEYGSFNFDAEKFPTIKNTIQDLKKMNFNFSIWISIFFNEFVYEKVLADDEKNYFVKEPLLNQVLRLDWSKSKNCSILDVTNPRARRWFIKKIRKHLTSYDIDSFFLDTGEISWFKDPFKLFDKQSESSPNQFSEFFTSLVNLYENSSLIEIKTSFNSQQNGNLIRISEKNSVWDYNNGLQSIIPSFLTYSIFGYPFLIPDVIGGNVIQNEKPDREIYLRWLALNSLLPVMHYSIGPWEYDSEVINISLKFQDLHNEFVPIFVNLSKDALETGFPIIRPLWWIEPEDNFTWTIDSQYLIGDKVMVVPILTPNTTKRDFYLTQGSWKDELKGSVLKGPNFIKNYEIKLNEIAYFTKIDDISK